MFTTNVHLKYLAKSEQVLADETFRITPKPWKVNKIKNNAKEKMTKIKNIARGKIKKADESNKQMIAEKDAIILKMEQEAKEKDAIIHFVCESSSYS